MNNIGRTLSEKARQKIDREFKLISPESKKINQHLHQKQMDETWAVNQLQLPRVRYGKTPTKAAIQKVVTFVMNEYKYTSLPEFNAVLKLYNIVADRGERESLMYKNGGLVYRVTDQAGNKMGTPIKASEFYSKPTLKNLENKFSNNEELRMARAKHVKFQIDWAIKKHPNLSNLISDLQNEGIKVLARQNADGRIYGMTFIDLKNKCVFNGSDLGRQYSANGIIERCGIKSENQQKENLKLALKVTQHEKEIISNHSQRNDDYDIEPPSIQDKMQFRFLEELVKPEPFVEGLAPELRQEKQKRKKRGLYL